MRAGQEGARSAARPCPGCSPPAPAAPPAVSWRSRRRCTVCALEGETPVFVSAPLSAGQAPRQLGLETFLTQESNLHLLNWGSILYLLRHRGSLNTPNQLNADGDSRRINIAIHHGGESDMTQQLNNTNKHFIMAASSKEASGIVREVPCKPEMKI
ncbi:uncharacterized protein ACBT57_000840 isoform 1-T1 [Dama dama]